MKLWLHIFFLTFLSAKAQIGKEAWHWHFGVLSGVDFSSGFPTPDSLSKMNSIEGCASISDPNTGQLLFYTNGITVWDRNNNQMPNGYGLFGGDGTSTQAALIVPKPCSANIYYLITTDQGGYTGINIGVHYSIIDMTLNGGLGDVIPSAKNILLTPPPTTEKVVGVKHGNGQSYWIITHSFLSNKFNAYLVSTNGINPVPVISNTGTIAMNVSGNRAETLGYLKASPNGKKLAMAINHKTDIVELYDFNDSTGIVSNPVTLPLTTEGPYGVSFSPDNSKLYATTADFDSTKYSKLYQYDISSGISSVIQASRIMIANTNYRDYFGALQLATNGKIYITGFDHPLSVINNPNALGLACNYQDSVIGYPFIYPQMGLPNFIDGGIFHTNALLITKNAIDTFLCAGSSITLNADNGFSHYFWSNGDTTKSIKTSGNGVYIVKCTLDSSQCFITDTFKSILQTYPKVNLGNDTVICSGSITLRAPNGCSSYLWNTGQTHNSIPVANAGTYWLAVNLNGCISSDTINIYTDTNHLHISYPNIVTPNDDNINDFISFGNDLFTSLHVEVFNRWGRKIFTSDNPSCFWYPNETDETISDGTVYYVAQYTALCGGETQKKTLRGFITIIK